MRTSALRSMIPLAALVAVTPFLMAPSCGQSSSDNPLGGLVPPPPTLRTYGPIAVGAAVAIYVEDLAPDATITGDAFDLLRDGTSLDVRAVKPGTATVHVHTFAGASEATYTALAADAIAVSTPCLVPSAASPPGALLISAGAFFKLHFVATSGGAVLETADWCPFVGAPIAVGLCGGGNVAFTVADRATITSPVDPALRIDVEALGPDAVDVVPTFGPATAAVGEAIALTSPAVDATTKRALCFDAFDRVLTIETRAVCTFNDGLTTRSHQGFLTAGDEAPPPDVVKGIGVGTCTVRAQITGATRSGEGVASFVDAGPTDAGVGEGGAADGGAEDANADGG